MSDVEVKSDTEPYLQMFLDTNDTTAAVVILDESPVDTAVVRMTVSLRAGMIDLDLSRRGTRDLIAELQNRLAFHIDAYGPDSDIRLVGGDVSANGAGVPVVEEVAPAGDIPTP